MIGLLRPVGNVMARRQMAFESKVEQSNCFPFNLIFHFRVKLITNLRIFSKSKTSFWNIPKHITESAIALQEALLWDSQGFSKNDTDKN